MKITFVIANPNMSGGVRVCAIYAQKFKELGHEVNIVAPKKRFLSVRKQVKRMVSGGLFLSKKSQMKNHFSLMGLDVTYANSFSPLASKDIPDADVVIATWWETAEWVNSFSENKGEKVYFIQGHEVYDYLPVHRVRATYRLPFYKITIASWLMKLMQTEYDSDKPFLVPNSVSHELFYASVRGKQDVPTIGFLFSENEFKGVGVALNVIANLKNKLPELRVIAFGAKPPAIINLPEYVELSVSPNQDQIRFLYMQCDVWLCCSLVEGFGLTILEAMACRTPVVSTKCGGPEDIVVDGHNGYLCEVNDVDLLVEASYGILNSSEGKWGAFSINAYNHAVDYTWDDAAISFSGFLQSIITDD